MSKQESLWGPLRNALVDICGQQATDRWDEWHARMLRVNGADATECSMLLDAIAIAIDDLGYPCERCGDLIGVVGPSDPVVCALCEDTEVMDRRESEAQQTRADRPRLELVRGGG